MYVMYTYQGSNYAILNLCLMYDYIFLPKWIEILVKIFKISPVMIEILTIDKKNSKKVTINLG